MHWLRKLSSLEKKELLKGGNNNHSDEMLRIKRIVPAYSDKIHISPLAEFFLRLSLSSGETNVVYIPITNQEDYEIAKKELAIHFQDVKVAYCDNTIKQLILQYIREETLQYLNKININKEEPDIITELFMLSDSNPIPQTNDVNIYETMHKDSINVERFKFLDDSFVFISSCYKNQDFLFTPSGWSLSDNLKDSNALSFLEHHSRRSFLWTNNDNQILYIHLKF
ncbi:hypothetical protein [Paenibacillus lautus]|uniref:hypothetical protein n=1 Tax=Paenibacillus lautus TaxID=1401 RepID=UPI001C7D2E49|nr:hypothetical protein [Paenibacillus lautus]MBX4152468.1 hypothetical protein [Paenibacillus lautus]